MPTTSPVVARIPRSGIRALMELATADPAALHLEIGEPDVPTPAHVLAAAAGDAAAGHTGYTSSTGSLELRAALAEKVRRVNGLDVGPHDVMATHGAMHGLAMAFAATLGPGDEVLLPDPEFPNWRMAALATGADVRTYPTRAADRFVPRIEEIEAAVTERTRVVLLCSPNNPTGAVYPPELLAAVVDLARRHDLWVFSDECYEAITYGVPHVSTATYDTDGRVVSFFSFSKTYAMTGWRLGYLVSPDRELTTVLAQLAEATVGCPSSVSQRAALAALRGPQEEVASAVASYRARRDQAAAALGAAGVPCVVPDGAFYLLVDVSAACPDGHEFALRLLREAHVAVSPGEAFGAGGAGLVRLSLASDPAALRRGVSALVDLVQRWVADRESPAGAEPLR